MDGERTRMIGAAHWRADATAAQMLRAARGLEEIAATCTGVRRDELLEMVDDLHARARARRDVERAVATPERATLR
jgi:hypothetical protein